MSIALTGVVLTSSASSAAPSPPDLVGKPVITFDRKHPGRGLTAYVRLDHPAPRASGGRPLVRVSLDQGTPATDQAVTVGRPSRSCYGVFRLSQTVTKLKTGRKLKVLVDIGPRSKFRRHRATVTLQGVAPLGASAQDNPTLKAMRCVNGR